MSTRILRTTVYIHPDEPMTFTVRDSDVVDTLESIMTAEPPSREPFIVTEIFTMAGNVSMHEATVEAFKRQQRNAELEHEKAIGYLWNAEQLTRVTPGGMLVNNLPAPYGAEDASDVALQLAKHPNYNHQTIMMVTKDRQVVIMKDGEVKVETP